MGRLPRCWARRAGQHHGALSSTASLLLVLLTTITKNKRASADYPVHAVSNDACSNHLHHQQRRHLLQLSSSGIVSAHHAPVAEHVHSHTSPSTIAIHHGHIVKRILKYCHLLEYSIWSIAYSDTRGSQARLLLVLVAFHPLRRKLIDMLTAWDLC